MVIDKTRCRGTKWVAQERQERIRMEGGRRRSGPLLLWGGGDPRQKAGEGARGGEGRVRWAGGWWQEWRRWGGEGTWHGVVRATVWSGLSAVGQLSAPLSSPRSASHTTYLAVKRPAALALPRPPSRLPPRPLPPSPPAFVFCISLVTVQALRRLFCQGFASCQVSYFADIKHLQLDILQKRVQHTAVEV